MNDLVTQPIVQYGFLGFSAVLLGVVVWLIQRLLALLEANNAIIAANTEAVNGNRELVRDLVKLVRSLHDKMLSRPCIARFEVVEDEED